EEKEPETKPEEVEKEEKKPAPKKKKTPKKDLDEKELLSKAKKIEISEIKFSAKVKKLLLSEGYETLADIMESGIGKVSEIKGLNDSEIKRIAKVITTFVNNL
ncbi:hypothetical protein KC675_03900, partial [Candidatus Dojkabacteria bacterium]|nr:hypothetical protein [Candidatus Dojkabacteria bacterium]